MTHHWKQQKGMTIVYWGDGKGKTTAAMGVAVRALGHGWNVYIAQFMKSEQWPSGERDFFSILPPLFKGGRRGVTVDVLGEGFVGIMGDRKDRAVHERAARDAYDKIRAVLIAGEHALVVLDEILSAVDEGLLTEEQILLLMRDRPLETTLVMTGHKQYAAIAAAADLITEMKKIKHPFDSGFIAMKGIDY